MENDEEYHDGQCCGHRIDSRDEHYCSSCGARLGHDFEKWNAIKNEHKRTNRKNGNSGKR